MQPADTTATGMAEVMEARQMAYRLLARLFLEEPDEAFLHELSRQGAFDTFLYGEQREAVQAASQKVAAALADLQTSGTDGFEALRSDYTRLFVGPDRLPTPPWESAYLTEERLLFQESTLEVRRAYRKYGLQVRNYPHEADDHLGFELEFMAHLAGLAARDVSTPAECLEGPALLADQESFLQDHLLRWVPAFAADVEMHAATAFYQALAVLLKDFIAADHQFMRSLRSV